MKKKIKFRRLLWIAVPLFALLLIWARIRIVDWRICRGRIVTVSNDICQIQTRYYNLDCPADWKGRILVEIAPMAEEYKGDPAFQKYYIKDIDPANYSLRILYTADGADAVIGDVQMYAHLEDCQDLKHWDYAGTLSAYTADNSYDIYVIVQYPNIAGSSDTKAQVKKMRKSLPKILTNLEPREKFLRRRDADTRLFWQENDDPEDHGQTWAQTMDDLYRGAMSDLERWKREEEDQYSSSDDSAPAASSRRSTYTPDPYDVYDYSDPEEFADDRLEDFSDSEGEDDEDEAWEEAYDYWEENHQSR